MIVVDGARGRDHPAVAPPESRSVLYVLSFLPTYILSELRELQRRGVRLTVIVPAPWPRAAMWDHITGLDRDAADGPELCTADFRSWLTRPPKTQPRRVAQLLARVWLRRGAPALRLARRSWRDGTFRHYLAAAWLSTVLTDRSPALGVGRGERRCAIDRVHAHFATDAALVAAALAELLDVPFSLMTHANDIFVPSDPRHVARLLAVATPALTISHFNREYLTRVFGPDIARRVRVLHLGVDLDRLPRWSPSEQVFTIVCAASGLVEKKGLDVLFEACALLRARGLRFRCQVCGADPGERRLAELREMVRGRGLADEISLLGALPWTETLQLMARANVVALPAIRAARGELDGIPVSLIEAMGIGVPVISTPVSGIPELIEDNRSGLLVPPGDAAALAGAIERLSGDAALAQALGAQARQRVRDGFSLPRCIDGLLAAWDECEAPRGRQRFG